MDDTALTNGTTQTVSTQFMGVPAISSELYVPGMESLTRDDISLPRLVLVQLTSKNLPDDYLAHFGEWYNTVTGEFSKTIDGVLLGIAKGRVAFPRDYDANSPAMCASDEALYPRKEFNGKTISDPKTNIIHAIDGTCADCPFSKFTNNVTPLCSLIYSYGFYDVKAGLPFVMVAKKTGIKAAKLLNMQIMKYGRANFVVLSASKVKDDNGNYAVPVFSSGEKLTPELVRAAAEFVRTFGNIAERVRVDEPDVPSANGNGPDEPPMPESGDMPF